MSLNDWLLEMSMQEANVLVIEWHLSNECGVSSEWLHLQTETEKESLLLSEGNVKEMRLMNEVMKSRRMSVASYVWGSNDDRLDGPEPPHLERPPSSDFAFQPLGFRVFFSNSGVPMMSDHSNRHAKQDPPAPAMVFGPR
jgi:hypothetical protein